MKKFNKIAIIGVGEIGGSIGKDLKRKHLCNEVIGIGRRTQSLKYAKKVRAIDKFFLIQRIKDGVKDADLIILATPVGRIVKLAKKAALHAKKGALITDVGSTKREIVKALEKGLVKKVRFVGSHPMAGSEKGGPLNARENLFKGRNCFITKTKNTDENALTKIQKFWKNLEANAMVVSLAEHDRIVAKVSQMVHIVASSLVIANKDVLDYVASGFKDTTRIALAGSELWKDICVTNNKNISKSLDELVKILQEFSKAILQKKSSKIRAMLEKARKLRKRIN